MPQAEEISTDFAAPKAPLCKGSCHANSVTEGLCGKVYGLPLVFGEIATFYCDNPSVILHLMCKMTAPLTQGSLCATLLHNIKACTAPIGVRAGFYYVVSLFSAKHTTLWLGVFQLNPSFRTGEIMPRRVKSLRGEIRFAGDWTDLISLSASAENFTSTKSKFHHGVTGHTQGIVIS